MEIDEKSSKLLIMFISINIVAAALGLATIALFGVLSGLILFTLLILTLPLGLQYFYLKKKSNNN